MLSPVLCCAFGLQFWFANFSGGHVRLLAKRTCVVVICSPLSRHGGGDMGAFRVNGWQLGISAAALAVCIAGIISTLMFMMPAVARDFGVQKHHGQSYEHIHAHA